MADDLAALVRRAFKAALDEIADNELGCTPLVILVLPNGDYQFLYGGGVPKTTLAGAAFGTGARIDAGTTSTVVIPPLIPRPGPEGPS